MELQFQMKLFPGHELSKAHDFLVLNSKIDLKIYCQTFMYEQNFQFVQTPFSPYTSMQFL